VRLLRATMLQTAAWPRYEQITSSHDSALDEVIIKPWGHEYRVYCDPFFDVWRLTIGPGHSTSEHCHPHKLTALICLSGSGRLRLLTGTYLLGAHDLVLIGRGVFHVTEVVGGEPLEVIEIEVPRNKFDLVRANDSYGRQASPYDQSSSDGKVKVGAMVDAPLIDSARYRPCCATGCSRFAVTTGKYLPRRRNAALYAALSLETHSALSDNITLLLSRTTWAETVDPHGVYLAITHSPPIHSTDTARSSRAATASSGQLAGDSSRCVPWPSTAAR
jgi:mannose-6-phosphate isomerase-like protein (cupin superfamily)